MANTGNGPIGKLEQTYAAALIELVQARDDVDTDVVAGQLQQIGQLAEDEPQLVQLLSAATINQQKRSLILEHLFKNQVHELLYRFLQVLNAKGRLPQLAGIAKAFAMLLAQQRGQIQVDAFVASKLDEQAVNRIAQGVGQVLEKQVTINQHVDEQLVGGLKLRIDDQLIDGSVATQLRLLRDKMIAQGREKARAAAL